MKRASHRVAHDQAIGKCAVIVRTGAADREDFIAAPRNNDVVVADLPREHAAVW